MTSRWLQALACLFVSAGLICGVAQAGIGLPERLVLLSERIAAAPTDQNLYLRRALVYSDTGEFKLALADVDTAAQFGPVENTHFVRAILLYRLGQFAQALPLLNGFIKTHPDHTEALMYRARVQRDAGQREAALADYRRYFALQPHAEPGDTLIAARLMVELAGQGRKGYSRRDALAFLDARIQQLGNNAPQLQRYAIEIEQQDCRSAKVLARLEALHLNARRAPQWQLQMVEQYVLLDAPDAARDRLAAAKMLLDERRPSADKAQLMHRHDFLRDVLALSTKDKQRGKDMDALYRQYYPLPKPDKTTQAHARGDFEGQMAERSHAALGGFEQPQPTVGQDEVAWSESAQAFQRCLRNRRPGSR